MVGRQDWYLENHPFLKPEPAESPPLQWLVVPCWFIHPLRRDESRVSGQTETRPLCLMKAYKAKPSRCNQLLLILLRIL